eukprot:TRINITY_DN20859_c0_g1_i1.p1 TRINITY_DN20859_c0_g1~~TRINITY_DN20859_c0_g1_i1.p1  ORF type:complete len:198 (+),score=7.94 TRINITY_DN20859_c0_g1_i1:195-788(+)
MNAVIVQHEPTRIPTDQWGMRDPATGFPQGDPITEHIEGHRRGVTRVHISPDEQFIYTASRDGTVRQWTAPPGPIQEVAMYKVCTSSSLFHMVVAPDGLRIFAADKTHVYRIDCLASYASPVKTRAMKSNISSLAVNVRSRFAFFFLEMRFFFLDHGHVEQSFGFLNSVCERVHVRTRSDCNSLANPPVPLPSHDLR